MPESLDAWLALLEGRHVRSIDLGLDRCGRVYLRVGAPHPAGTVFTVAGTNGKGSVTAYLASMLQAAGMKCGTYTSPHILRFNERICIDGAPAGDAEIMRAFEAVEAALHGDSLTYFEFTTLAALHHFQARGLDAAVLEVGLGGRLDAVNLVDSECAVITAIGLDHQEYLGADREQIGFEKAGVMRAGRPVVCGDRRPPASLLRHARDINAQLLRIGIDFEAEPAGQGLRLRVGERWLEVDRLPLPGRHQADNLAAAVAALGAVFPHLLDAPDVLLQGLSATHVPGRLQRHPGDPRVLLDVGHNPLAAEAVARHLGDRARGRSFCVLGMLGDKDVAGVARALAPTIGTWYCGGLGGARGQSGAALATRVGQAVADGRVRDFESVPQALAAALGDAAPGATVLVFGSFQTVAAALRALAGGSVHGPS